MMPYKSNRELPKSVKDAIQSGKGRSIIRNVVNSQLDAGKSENVAFASAWAALQRAGYEKNKQGIWIKKEISKLDKQLIDALRQSNCQDLCYNSQELHEVDEMKKRQINDDMFTVDLEAKARSVDLGFGGEIHVHQTSDGQAVYMPGASHEEYLEQYEEMAGIEEYEEREPKIEITITVKSEGDVLKSDEEQRIIYGWASVIEKDGESVVDKQGDIIEEDELVSAVHDFVTNSRQGKVMHKGEQTSRIVDSIVFTKDLQKAMGIDLGKVGWFVGVKVDDDEAWNLAKSGELPMFSIGGRAIREPIDD